MNETRLIGQILRSMSALEMEIHNTPLTDADFKVIELLVDSRKTLTQGLAIYKEHREKARAERIDKIRQWVNEADLKQSEFAKKAGCTPEHLSSVLSGRYTLTDDLFEKIRTFATFKKQI